MTERLTTLLRDEAAGFDVPPAPVTTLLRRAHRQRTRRRVGAGVALATALSTVAGSALLLQHTFRPAEKGDRPDLTDPLTAYYEGGAYAVGSTVWFGDGRTSVDIQGKVKALYYTSAGVVVRAGKVPWTDSAGASHYALATLDGHLEPLDLTLGDVKPGTSPSSPYVAYAAGPTPADRGNDTWAIHLVDVRTDTDTVAGTVTGAFTWGGWAAPPVALDGGTVYVALDRAMVALDTVTGRARDVGSLPESYFPTVAGGHGERPSPGSNADADEVVDVATGQVLLPPAETPAETTSGSAQLRCDECHSFSSFTRLSPEGRYAVQTTWGLDTDDPFPATVYDLDTGRGAELTGSSQGLGWTPDGRLLRVTRSKVSVCEPIAGTCQTHPVDLGEGVIRIGGNDNES